MLKVGLTLTPSVLAAMGALGLLRDDSDIAVTRYGADSPELAPFAPYDRPPFDQNPIRSPFARRTGWVREFSGPVSAEYRTGFLYRGLRLIRGSWDGIYPPHHYAKTSPLTHWRRRQRIGAGIMLTGIWHENYYHFLCDFVPKIPVVERSRLPTTIPYVVKESLQHRRYFAEAQALGLFGERPVVFHKPRHWLEAERLFTVYPDRLPGAADGFVAGRLGARPDPRGRRRLFVSRNVATGTARGIRNEPALIPGLVSRGFEIVDPGSWPLKEQIERFSQASVVVGPHGAGLTNIVFRAGAPLALVEIISSSKVWRHHFYEMCSHHGYFYRPVLGPSTNPADENAPFDADVDATFAAIDEALAWEEQRYSA